MNWGGLSLDHVALCQFILTCANSPQLYCYCHPCVIKGQLDELQD